MFSYILDYVRLYDSIRQIHLENNLNIFISRDTHRLIKKLFNCQGN